MRIDKKIKKDNNYNQPAPRDDSPKKKAATDKDKKTEESNSALK